MSNPEKMKVDESKEENQDSEATLSDDDVYMREIVLGLPALTVSERRSVSNVVEAREEEARLNEQAVVAAELVMAAAEEAVMQGEKKKKKKKKVSRRRKTSKADDEACASSNVETKKPRRRSSELTNPPKGPPVCNICGRPFSSWKAVFGHLRTHKDRNYQGFLPPPKFSPVAEGFPIPGQNSAFVIVAAVGGSSGGFPSRGGGAAVHGGEGGRGLGIDLNVDPVEEEDREVTESESFAKFDLNKPPPKDEEKEDKAK